MKLTPNPALVLALLLSSFFSPRSVLAEADHSKKIETAIMNRIAARQQMMVSVPSVELTEEAQELLSGIIQSTEQKSEGFKRAGGPVYEITGSQLARPISRPTEEIVNLIFDAIENEVQ